MNVFEGGFVTWHDSNNNFEASCLEHLPERCTLTRSGAEGAAGSADTAVGGRPLGFLVAWLRLGATCADKSEHRKPAVLKALASDAEHDWRKTIRAEVRLRADCRELLDKEVGGFDNADEPRKVR